MLLQEGGGSRKSWNRTGFEVILDQNGSDLHCGYIARALGMVVVVQNDNLANRGAMEVM